MRQYYYLIGSEKMGPYSLEELKAKNISRETLVWHNDLEDWTPAHKVDELKSMYQLSPPEIKQPQQPTGSSSFGTSTSSSNSGGSPFGTSGSGYRPPRPKTWLTEAILVTLFCCWPLGIVGIIYASKVESRYNAGDFDGAEKASKDAALWTKIGFWSIFILGGLVVFLSIIVEVLGG